MSRHKLSLGLAGLILTGCINQPEFQMKKDIPHVDTKEGHFIEHGQRYFSEDGKRYILQNYDGVDKRFELKWDGKEYYVPLGQGVLPN